MLTIKTLPAGQIVTVGWKISNASGGIPSQTHGTVFWGAQTLPNVAWKVDLNDPIIGLLVDTCLESGPWTVKQAFGFPTVEYHSEEFGLMGDVPLQLPYNGPVDHTRHSTFFAGLYTALHRQRDRADVADREHEVHHLNFHGVAYNFNPDTNRHWDFDYVAGQAGNGLTYYDSSIFYDWVYPRGRGYSVGVWDAVQQRFTSYTGLKDGGTCLCKVPTFYMLAWWQQYGSTHRIVSGSSSWRVTYDISITDLSRDPHTGAIDCSYVLLIRSYMSGEYPNGRYVEWTLSRRIQLSLYQGILANNPATSGQKSLDIGLRIYHVSSKQGPVWYRNGLQWNQHWLADSIASTPVNYYQASYYRSSWYRGEGPVLITNFTNGSTIGDVASAAFHGGYKLRDYYKNNETQLTSSCYLSANDALRKLLDVVSSNQLEFINDWKGLKGLLPPLGKLMQLMISIRRGDLSGSIRGGLDLYTSAHLYKTYGWDPLASDTMEFIDSYDALVDRLRTEGVWGLKTLYGKFDYDLPDQSAFGPIHMTTRSKIRLGFDDTTLLSIIFRVGGAGFLPTLARVWDCIPFSFVVDWFTNLGDRFEDIDTQSILFLLPHYYSVHSIALYSRWSSSFMEPLGLDGGDADAPETTYYNRWLSYILPTFRPSKFDFREAGGIPSWTTAGSLAYQIGSNL